MMRGIGVETADLPNLSPFQGFEEVFTETPTFWISLVSKDPVGVVRDADAKCQGRSV
jgi:hypothetical protein